MKTLHVANANSQKLTEVSRATAAAAAHTKEKEAAKTKRLIRGRGSLQGYRAVLGQ